MQHDDLTLIPMPAGLAVDVARHNDGFIAAYGGLFRDAYRVAFRLLGDREEAEDIAQEACIRACQRWRRLSEGGYAAPWVVRVSTNLALDRWRRLRCAERYLDYAPGTTAPVDALRVDLHRALESLPRRQREVVVLRYVADMPEADVALQLRCSIGTVKTHASRGLTALRSKLRDRGEVL
jgi:RNA polymerase sigma-70 factor (sigma-E family)